MNQPWMEIVEYFRKHGWSPVRCVNCDFVWRKHDLVYKSKGLIGPAMIRKNIADGVDFVEHCPNCHTEEATS